MPALKITAGILMIWAAFVIVCATTYSAIEEVKGWRMLRFGIILGTAIVGVMLIGCSYFNIWRALIS